MQDAKRLEEQVNEMTLKAEVRAAVAEDHRKMALQRRDTAERELAKFRSLHESFTVGEQLLLQRRQQLLNQDPQPGAPIFEGIVAATEQLQALQKQAQDMILKHEGAYQAFQVFEETFRQQGIEATSRGRGIEVQGQKAVDVAGRRVEGSSVETTLSEEDGDESSTKEPIGRSRKKAGKKRSRRKLES
jgi:hypothetical protein